MSRGKAKKKPDGSNVVCRNKKARFSYEIEDTLEAGMALTGSEVKSLRMGKANLKDSYATIKNGELWLVNCHISEYPFASIGNHDPERRRKLLVTKRQLKRLTGKIQERGLTLVPLKIYFKAGWAKVQLGLGRGKKLHDKRETIKRRDQQREADRAMRHREW